MPAYWWRLAKSMIVEYKKDTDLVTPYSRQIRGRVLAPRRAHQIMNEGPQKVSEFLVWVIPDFRTGGACFTRGI